MTGTVASAVHSRLGRDTGWLVLRLEQHVQQSRGEIRRGLLVTGSAHSWITVGFMRVLADEPDPHGSAEFGHPLAFEAARWEVDEGVRGTYLALTTWVDGDEPDEAAHACADCHTSFEALSQLIGARCPRPNAPALAPSAGADLVRRYRSEVAAVLADTD